MPVPTDPGDFANDTLADAAEVNARFTPLYAALNGALDETNHAVPKGIMGAYRSADVSLATTGLIVLDAEEFDVSGWFNTATGLYTPQVAGYYRIGWQVAATVQTSNHWVSVLYKNGVLAKHGNQGGNSGLNGISSGTAIVLANGTTDTFGIGVGNLAVTVAVRGGAAYTYMHAELIGRS